MPIYLVLHYNEPVIAFEEIFDAEDFIKDMIEEGEQENSLSIMVVNEDSDDLLEEYELTYDKVLEVI